MKTDIHSPPPPLDFGKGDEAFKLKLKRFDGPERQSVVDGLNSGSMEFLQRAIDPLVIGWEGVFDSEGNPVPFETLDDKRQTVRNFGKFMGAIPFVTQIEVVAGIVAFLDLPMGDIESMLDRLRPVATTPDLDPTDRPGGDTPTPASGD